MFAKSLRGWPAHLPGPCCSAPQVSIHVCEVRSRRGCMSWKGREGTCSLSVLTPGTGVSCQLAVGSQVRVNASPRGWLLGSSSSLISNFLSHHFIPSNSHSAPDSQFVCTHTNSDPSYPACLVTDKHAHRWRALYVFQGSA